MENGSKPLVILLTSDFCPLKQFRLQGYQIRGRISRQLTEIGPCNLNLLE